MSNELGEEPNGRNENVVGAIGRKAERKMEARSRRDEGIWFGLGMFGLVGWSVAIPTLLGVAVGFWLDARFPGRVSWTLTMLFVGVILGCLNAWYWVQRESRQARREPRRGGES